MSGESPVVDAATTDRHKGVVRRLVVARNAGDTADLAEIIHPDWTLVNPTVTLSSRGPQAMAEAFARVKSLFPDSTVTIEDLVAEGDKVVTRYSWAATHQIDLNTRDGRLTSRPSDPPDGRSLRFTGIAIDRFHEGRIIETWENQDALGLLQQLGQIPS